LAAAGALVVVMVALVVLVAVDQELQTEEAQIQVDQVLLVKEMQAVMVLLLESKIHLVLAEAAVLVVVANLLEEIQAEGVMGVQVQRLLLQDHQ
jgi:hypothetical protein